MNIPKEQINMMQFNLIHITFKHITFNAVKQHFNDMDYYYADDEELVRLIKEVEDMRLDLSMHA